MSTNELGLKYEFILSLRGKKICQLDVFKNNQLKETHIWGFKAS